eukprot:3217595-Pyramimonas_sp.AAC.1
MALQLPAVVVCTLAVTGTGGPVTTREYSGPRPTGRTRAGNILALGQRGGLVRGIFWPSANGADSCAEYSHTRYYYSRRRPLGTLAAQRGATH